MRPLADFSGSSSCSDYSADEAEKRKQRRKVRPTTTEVVEVECGKNAMRHILNEQLDEFVSELAELVACFYFEERTARRRYYYWKVTSLPKKIDAASLQSLLDKINSDDKDYPHAAMMKTFEYIEGRRRDLKETIQHFLKESCAPPPPSPSPSQSAVDEGGGNLPNETVAS